MSPAFVFKIIFRDIKPPVWRRFVISSTATFWELHIAIQGVLGWSNTRLHEFIVQRIEPRQAQRVMPFSEGFNDLPLVISQETMIKHYFSEEKTIGYYNYPLLDEWFLKLNLEAIIQARPDQNYPQCLDGTGAAPPESCGGIKGYQLLQKAIKKPRDPQHQQAMTLLGKGYDPVYFNKDKITFLDPDIALKQFHMLVTPLNMIM